MDTKRIRELLKTPEFKRLAPRIVAASVFVLFAACVWPTVYRYDHINIDGGVHPVRIHRISGRTDVLFASGWQAARPHPTTRPQAQVQLPPAELNKLEGNGHVSGGTLYINVYNGTNYDLYEITVHVKVTGTGPLIDRDYKLSNSFPVHPMESGIFDALAGFQVEPGQKFAWDIVKAGGTEVAD